MHAVVRAAHLPQRRRVYLEDAWRQGVRLSGKSLNEAERLDQRLKIVAVVGDEVRLEPSPLVLIVATQVGRILHLRIQSTCDRTRLGDAEKVCHLGQSELWNW